MYSAANTRHLMARRMSDALPLFTSHLQLPLFTGHRHWHTMFGQLDQLATSDGCVDASAVNADEDVLAESNFSSLFDSECHNPVGQCNTNVGCEFHPRCHSTNASPLVTEGCRTAETSRELSEHTAVGLTDNSFPSLDENVDSVHSAVEEFMLSANMHPLNHVTNYEMPALESSHIDRPACHGSVGGSQSHTWRGRRHSDPGSIHSSANHSSSANSSSENWYYYDHRLGPGGPLAAQYGRLWTRLRSLSVIAFPPTYDDAVQPVARTEATTEHHTADHCLSVSQSACDNLTEAPPPYSEADLPPSYSEVATTDPNEQLCSAVSPLSSTQNWHSAEDHFIGTRCSFSHGMFGARPAVRWNRNTRVERWTSSFNWVMS